ncbi:MAG: DUF1015 domain-containing protein [Deltaproteobacteria bacterium]|nr:DUF1015 domain-containing protein [Deltaproteobacteria bacterium]
MTAVRPFRALRYDPSRVELSRVIVPPYDVIAADEREGFYERDPYNAIRFELTRNLAEEASTDYSEVGETLATWRREGILAGDETPAYYVMAQRFTAPDGRKLERIGFFAELGLENYESRVVLPHELTLAGPKADRLKVLRAARANLSSVFLLYEDREQVLAEILSSAFVQGVVGRAVDDAGVEYVLARLDDPAGVETVRSFMADRSAVIADGHHRYETALAYRDEQRALLSQRDPEASQRDPEARFEGTLAYFANAYAPGSLLLPIHRVLLTSAVAAAPDAAQWAASLPDWQSRLVPLEAGASVSSLLADHLAPLAGHPAFVADDGGDSLRLFWQDRPLGEDLGVRILEREVLGGVFGLEPAAIREGAVSFPKSAERAALDVRSGVGCVALYLNPLLPEDVFRVTGSGEVMPPKSTFFYPKVPTGLVFRDHRD